MDHNDHVKLIRGGIEKQGGIWADFGSGWGAFTLAIRDVAGPNVSIHSVDKDGGRLEEQRANFAKKFPDTDIKYLHKDFTQPLPLPKLDGVLMANSLHFFSDKIGILQQIKAYLKPGGRLIIVEYDTDDGNIWVPYPVSFHALGPIAKQAGFGRARLLDRHPSGFLRSIYSAFCTGK